MAFCLAPEVSKAQPSLLLALSAQGNKPLTTRSKRECCWTAGPCSWGGVGWGARPGFQATRSSPHRLSLKEASELGWSHQLLPGFISLTFTEWSMGDSIEPSRLPRDIPCMPGVKDLAPE